MENRHYCSRQKVLQMIQIQNDCRILILWQSAIRFVNFTVVCGPSLNETCDNCERDLWQLCITQFDIGLCGRLQMQILTLLELGLIREHNRFHGTLSGGTVTNAAGTHMNSKVTCCPSHCWVETRVEWFEITFDCAKPQLGSRTVYFAPRR